MERKLIKAGIYGFILGLFISILYFPEVKTINIDNETFANYSVPLRELIFDILRFAIKVSIAFVLSFWIINFYRELKKEKIDLKKSIIDFLKAFILVSIIIVVVYFLIGVLIK